MSSCIEKIYSVSALIGGPGCNGNCAFCAGKYLRPDAEPDNPIFWKNFETAIKLCARYGGWSLSLTSSGEPTVYPESVTKALTIYKKCADQGAFLPNVNLFTNGIKFGDKNFCKDWLPEWRSLGLTNVAISVHSTSQYEQAKAYGLRTGLEILDKQGKVLEERRLPDGGLTFADMGCKYPKFEDIRQNIIDQGVGVRATVLLRKGAIEDGASYKSAVDKMIDMGYDNITSWPVGNPDGTRNEFTPSRMGLASIRYWLWKNAKKCHSHSWASGIVGGGVYDYKGNILRLTDYVTKHDPSKDFVRQLVVFQDGLVSYSWIREGALCQR